MTSNKLSPNPEAFLTVLDGLVQAQKVISNMQALEALLYSAAAEYALACAGEKSRSGSDAEIAWRSTAMEVGAALRVSDRAVSGRMNRAQSLVTRFPATMDAWVTGSITRDHAHAILDAGAPISTDESRSAFEERILAFAGEETPARTRATARVIAARLDTDVIKKRQHDALDLRDVRLVDLDDGISELIATLPTTLAHGIIDRLTQTAKAVANAEKNAVEAQRARALRSGVGADVDGTGTAGDGGQLSSARAELPAIVDATALGNPDDAVTIARRISNLRADVFADLLLTGVPSAAQIPDTAEGRALDLGAIRGRVNIVVTEDALFGRSDDLPIIDGGGAFPIEDARELAAATGTWDRLTIDPALNMLTKVDSYRPTIEQRRYLTALDEHCRQPGCTRQAMWCDVDHAHDAALGGATELGNLSNLCEAHHVIKHADGWTISKRPDGSLLWTSKHGRVYPDVPRPAVAFMVSPPDREESGDAQRGGPPPRDPADASIPF